MNKIYQDERLKAAYKQSLEETESKIKHWSEQKQKYQVLCDRLQTLPDLPSYEVTVPFGPYAFKKGQLVHTNEMLVHLGDKYFAEVTCKQAVEIARHRMDKIDKNQLDRLRQIKENLMKADEVTDKLRRESGEGFTDFNKENVPEPKDRRGKRVSRVLNEDQLKRIEENKKKLQQKKFDRTKESRKDEKNTEEVNKIFETDDSSESSANNEKMSADQLLKSMNNFCADNQEKYKEIEEKIEDCQSKNKSERKTNASEIIKKMKPQKNKLTAEEKAKHLKNFNEIFNEYNEEEGESDEETSDEESPQTFTKKRREVIFPANANDLKTDFVTSHRAVKKSLTWKLPPSTHLDSDDSEDDVIVQNDVETQKKVVNERNVIRFNHSKNESFQVSNDGLIRSPADVPTTIKSSSATSIPKSILKKSSHFECKEEKDVVISEKVLMKKALKLESRSIKTKVVEKCSIGQQGRNNSGSKKKRPSKFKLSQLK